jgi:hypothetical protein
LLVFVPDGESGYEAGLAWLCTRRIIADENEEVPEVEKDKAIKKKFAKSISKGFDEEKMQFFVRRIKPI